MLSLEAFFTHNEFQSILMISSQTKNKMLKNSDENSAPQTKQTTTVRILVTLKSWILRHSQAFRSVLYQTECETQRVFPRTMIKVRSRHHNFAFPHLLRFLVKLLFGLDFWVGVLGSSERRERDEEDEKYLKIIQNHERSDNRSRSRRKIDNITIRGEDTRDRTCENTKHSKVNKLNSIVITTQTKAEYLASDARPAPNSFPIRTDTAVPIPKWYHEC